MLPGKKYHLEEIVQVLWQRIWLLLVPFAVVSSVVAIVVRLMPDTYTASAMVAVVPQQVPESIVRPTITSRLSDRLQAIENQVLSRPRLERLIVDLNLYAEERRVGVMEDVVQQMRRRVRITPQGAVAFRVTFTGPEPLSTKRVVDQIASDFIAESLVDRSRQAERTNQFIDSVLEDARQRLLEREAAIAAYKRQHGHELPAQTQTNLAAMTASNAQAQAASQSRSTASERRLQLERQLQTELDTPVGCTPVAAVGTPGAAGARATPPGSAAQELAAARQQLEAATARWTTVHPEVQRLTTLVRDLEARAQAELVARTGVSAAAAGMSPAELARAARIAELQKTIGEIDGQIGRFDAEEQRLREQAAMYRARIEAAPLRDNELADLMRGYPAIVAQFDDLNRKSENTRLQASLERQEIGQQFRLLEQALLPERPSSPDRQSLTLLGMVAGFGVGLGLIALLEYRDGSFKTDSEVSAVLSIPVLAVVPVMQSDEERRRALTWRIVFGVGVGAAVVVCLAFVAYSLVR
jgi:polysaccharide chain length determinant protein (PEP-CTERM system associated)